MLSTLLIIWTVVNVDYLANNISHFLAAKYDLFVATHGPRGHCHLGWILAETVRKNLHKMSGGSETGVFRMPRCIKKRGKCSVQIVALKILLRMIFFIAVSFMQM